MKTKRLLKKSKAHLSIFLIVSIIITIIVTVPVTTNAATSSNWVWPTSNHTIKNDWPNYASGGPHSGTDFSVPLNTPVYSSCDGEVVDVKSLTYSYGKHIKIRAKVNGGNVYIRYCHLNGFNVNVGDKVRAGQQIGISGSTGKSTGPHLHYEVRNSKDEYGTNGSATLRPSNYLPGSSYTYETYNDVPDPITPVIPDPVPQPDPTLPIGVTDVCEGMPGAVHVRGWAFDPTNTGHDTFVHVYIGGKVGDPNAEGHAITANLAGRSDVDSAYHCGDHHAFYENISTKKRGKQEVHVYALNADCSKSTPIGDFTVNIHPTDSISIQQIPNDYCNNNLDKVEVIDGNKLHIVGWAFAKATPADYSLVDVYIGGMAGSGEVEEAQRCLASVKRTDVYDAFKSQYSNMVANHGFDTTFTVGARGTYTLYFYAVDQTGKVPVNPEFARAFNVTFTDPPAKENLDPIQPETQPATQPETQPATQPTTAPPTVAPTTEPVTIPTVPTNPTEPATDPINPDAPQLIASNKAAQAGSVVNVDIIIKNNPGIIGMTLDVKYNKEALKLTEVKDRGILGVNSHKPEMTSPYTLTWSNDAVSKNLTENGVIATLVFKVDENAAKGDYPIELSYDYDNYDIYNVDIEKVKFETVSGMISVKDVLYGDVDGNGVVNNIDRVYLTRYLAKWDDFQNINKANADVNNDGNVNNIDKVILARHLSKWEAYSSLPHAM